MATLHSQARMGLSVKGMSDEDIRSMLLGEIFWNISQVETEMSLVIGHAMGMKPFDALQSIRDLNLDSKIRILEANASRISIRFEAESDRKKFFQDLRKLKDVRNAIAHGAIFADEKGLYFNIPTRASVSRNSSSVSVERADLEEIFVLTAMIATGFMLARGGGQIKIGKEL